MKIVLWIGNEPIQMALANKVNEAFPISGIITESRASSPKITLKKMAEKIFERIYLSSIGKSWWNLQKYYNQSFNEYPKVDLLDVENINSEEAYIFTQKHAPDLILISGTRLVKEKMLSIHPKIGIINLHTGLSPYIKGGPNCTNWCIATKQFHLIGNTIMWIDMGIDTGNILTTEFTNLIGNENLLELHKKVMDHAHQLSLKAISYLKNGLHNSIPQKDIAKGKTYYTREWTLKQKLDLVSNLRILNQYIGSGKMYEDQKEIQIIELKEVS